MFEELLRYRIVYAWEMRDLWKHLSSQKEQSDAGYCLAGATGMVSILTAIIKSLSVTPPSA